MFYYLSKEKYGFCDTKKRSKDIWLRLIPQSPQQPILDFVRKSTQKERKRYTAPRSLSLQCFAFETLPSTVLILNLFCGCVNTFFYCLVQALKKITKKTEKIIAITIVKIFLHLFFAHTMYYTSNTIYCRTIF